MMGILNPEQWRALVRACQSHNMGCPSMGRYDICTLRICIPAASILNTSAVRCSPPLCPPVIRPVDDSPRGCPTSQRPPADPRRGVASRTNIFLRICAILVEVIRSFDGRQGVVFGCWSFGIHPCRCWACANAMHKASELYWEHSVLSMKDCIA